ncbi:MAG TPA: ABC transporter ATP-binding protein [Candidatus Saccharimonadales bacterium]|nr:ABC transporter ATP-binding protein [Candidatus Saccharimonadales bacterium]
MLKAFKPIGVFLSYLRRRPWLFLGSFLMGPAVALQTVISPLFAAKALGQLTSRHHASLSNVAFAGLALVGGASLYFLVDRFITTRLHAETLEDMYNDCFKQLLKQEYAFFSDNFSGSLVTQANRFVKAYEQFHITFFLDMLGQVTGVLLAVGITIYYNPLIGTAVGLIWLGSISLIAYLTSRRMPVRRAAVAIESEQTGELADVLSNAITVETFAAASHEAKRYNQTNVKRKQAFLRSWAIGIRNNLLVSMLCALLQIIVLFGGIKAVENHSISFAIFLLFQVYVLRVIDSISKANLSIRFIEGVLGDAHEMTELFERSSGVPDPDKPEPLGINNGLVEFKQVAFDYHGQSEADNSLFNGLSLVIQPGERVGLVGPSGGGKTTITKLLLRFMDVQAGAIVIDGQDIRSIRQDDLRAAIAYVPQEPLLFHRSLMENIRYGRPGATTEEVIEAARRAHAHEFISSLPNGYDTLVGERGIKLSGGQRQRVAIARAILKNAPVLILDEATSALDSESERYIQAALWELMKDKTSVVIAHRLSTIQHLDRIVVLDEGKIVEEGSHKQLLELGGTYARLWSHQSGGFIEE